MERYEGFREFVVARGSALSRSAYLLTGDHSAAEELLQAALARTVAHWRRAADGDPEAYVRRTMINLRTSWWRRRRYAADVPVGPEDVPATDDAADAVVRRMTLVSALAQLPLRQRAVLVLRFFEDLTEAQTAEILGCSVGTVKSQTHDALARLRTLAPNALTEHSDRPEGRKVPR